MSPRKHTGRLWIIGPLLAVATALITSACTPAAEGRFVDSASPGSTETITWKECQKEGEELVGSSVSSARFECGTLNVPANWADLEGKTLPIALLRTRAKNQKDRIGSLLVNPGGPGASGRQLSAAAAQFLPSEVLQRFDIVGFDPRGVGESSPVHCVSDAFKDATIALDPDPQDQTTFNEQVLSAKEFVAGCLDDKGENAKYFSTIQTARDMEAIRKAVGDEKLTYLGYSYGTLLGAVYAQLYPNTIRAMVLDGAVDPRQGNVEASKGQAAGFEKAFDNFAAWCTARESCKLGPDVRATTMRIKEQIRENPVKDRDGRIATVGHVQFAIASAMYIKDAWPVLEQSLIDIEDGDPSGIFTLSDLFFGREDNGDYDNSTDANTTINCVDRNETITPEQVQSLQNEWRTTYPLFGGMLATTLLTCEGWPTDAHDPYPVGAAEGAPPIVVIGTTGDPATPYENTAVLAGLLGTGRVVTQVGEGHTSYPQGSRCLATAITNYLISADPPEDGLRCE